MVTRGEGGDRLKDGSDCDLHELEGQHRFGTMVSSRSR